MRRVLLTVLVLALSGCGLGAGDERSGTVELRVTRDFGQERLGTVREEDLREGQTVMRLLRSGFDVETRFGGRFVQELEGLAGRGAEGRVDWFYFVNGIEANVGAADFELSPGDVVQWDYRRWDGAMRAPAIVGAFPEPFRTGYKGKRLPVRVECVDAEARSCTIAKRKLRELGVNAGGAVLGTSGTQNVARVIVGEWRRAKLVPAIEALADGPDESGVFARFADDGRRLELLEPGGEIGRTAPAGTGLVAAFAPSEEEIIWAVTGPDERAARAAASALERDVLRDAYAVAATPAGNLALPVEASG